MNIERKVEIAKTAILSLSRHDDEPTETVTAALDELTKFIADEAKHIEPRKKKARKTAKQEE
jgi:hypothetical protein